MASPVFGLPSESSKLKIALIIQPKMDANWLRIGVAFFVSSKPVNEKILLYGTGSYPPLENGLHLKILHAARMPPLKAPYF